MIKTSKPPARAEDHLSATESDYRQQISHHPAPALSPLGSSAKHRREALYSKSEELAAPVQKWRKLAGGDCW